MSQLKDYEQSLSEVLGKRIADIAGYVSDEYGEDTLVFKVSRVIFSDGSSEYVQGEHDMPYIPAQNNATWESHYKPDA